MNKTDSPLLLGLRAARANLVPGLIVQAFMLTLVLGYYWYPPFRDSLAHLAHLKETWGYLFSAIMSAIAGGIIPELFCITIFQSCRPNLQNLRNTLFAVVYWAVDGVIIDALYRFQVVLFGSGNDFATVTKKMLFDQFIFTPLIAIPFGLFCYRWKNNGYSMGAMRLYFTWDYHRDNSIPAVIANWGVWIPLVILIYSLPSDLQIPMFGLALTFWVMMFTYITTHQQRAAAAKLDTPVVTPAD